MKRNRLRHTLILLLLLAITACAPTGGAPPTSPPLLTLVPQTPTTHPTETAVSPTATATAPATSTTQPAPPTLAPPVNQDPMIITHDATNVRRGPGLAYEVSYVLGAGTAAPILGRNDAGDWWAVPGPGDGPGPVGWVSAAVVAVQGSTGQAPILLAPPLTPDLPLLGNTGQPVGDNCTVSHPGPGDGGPLFVYAAPNADAVAEFGFNRWATVIGRDNEWYHIQDAAGLSGWVPVAQVAHNGLCQPDDGPGSLPLIENPGSPPADRCIANRPGQFPPPNIYLGPGPQFALIARLGNWAEVLQSSAGWHQIWLGPGDIGWISDADVDLNGTCLWVEPVPERIQFAPGETSITLDSMLEPPLRDVYVFRAFSGQRVTLEIVSESNRANFAISGVDDGQPYKRLEDELRSWNATLPTMQDYLLTVAAPADAPTTGYRLTLTIEPLDE